MARRHQKKSHSKRHPHKKRNKTFKPHRKKRPQASKTFYGARRFMLRHPLISSVGSIVLAIILIRISFSNTLFGSDVSEFRIWFILFAILLGIIGLFAIKVWWKKNVPDFFGKGDITWRNR